MFKLVITLPTLLLAFCHGRDNLHPKVGATCPVCTCFLNASELGEGTDISLQLSALSTYAIKNKKDQVGIHKDGSS